MNLFETVDDLRKSGYLFRITDNGGETFDRITVTFCDGDAILCSETTICAHVERIDVQIDEDEVEAGVSRDLRWIDLDPDLQRAILADLNRGFSDWIEEAPAFDNRRGTPSWDGTWRPNSDERAPIFREAFTPAPFYVRDDEREDHGPYVTFADAVRAILPQDHDLSGPEYHSTVDLWSEEGGAKLYWNRKEDPPVIQAGSEFARALIVHEPEGTTPVDQLTRVAWFANVTDAENYIGTHLEKTDPDGVHAGRYTIDDLDHEDAPTRRK